MFVLEYFEQSPHAFHVALLVVLVSNAIVFFVGGRMAEKRFKGPAQRVLFRERGASGRSNRTLLTRMGGAAGVLDVIVTEQELWLKGIWPLFSYIFAMFDLTHRVPKSSIRKVTRRDGIVELWFENERGRQVHVELELRDPQAFESALAA
jgi:hypothetical protein